MPGWSIYGLNSKNFATKPIFQGPILSLSHMNSIRSKEPYEKSRTRSDKISRFLSLNVFPVPIVTVTAATLGTLASYGQAGTGNVHCIDRCRISSSARREDFPSPPSPFFHHTIRHRAPPSLTPSPRRNTISQPTGGFEIR